jgi:hypothetical protein
MLQRWYDQSPSLSMAVSLLHNASHEHQELAIHFMEQWMREHELYDAAVRARSEEQSRFFRFPFGRRSDRSRGVKGVVELFKHLPHNFRVDLAVLLINYMYTVEFGLSELEFPNQEPLISFGMSSL